MPGSDGSSFVTWRMRHPSITFGDLMFSENVLDGITYTLARFVTAVPPLTPVSSQKSLAVSPPVPKSPRQTGPQFFESLIPGNLVTTQDHGNQQIS